MQRIQLYTARGGFVLETHILPFVEPPGVVEWMERYFVFRGCAVVTKTWVYNESLLYPLIDGLNHDQTSGA